MGRGVSGLILTATFAALLTWSERAQAQDTLCSTAIAAASEINAAALFQGAVACDREDNSADAHLLLILGQIRGLSDMTILEPLNKTDEQKAGELYGIIFYQFGGLGSPDFYRIPANVDVLERRLRETNLSFFEHYDPGWSFKPTSKIDIYTQYLTNVLERRIWEVRNQALLWQNDGYFELSQALEMLQRDNPMLRVDTPAYDEFLRLTAEMAEIAKSIPQPPEPELNVPYARLNEQDAEAAAQQVAMGFNGPAMQGTYVFRSDAEVRESWLSEAMTADEIDALLSKVDFSNQILVGFAFGKRMNASSQVIIAKLGFNEGQGYAISTRIGVVPETCGIEFTASYPFVLGVTDAVSPAGVNAQATSNFPAECGPIMSGNPVTQP